MPTGDREGKNRRDITYLVSLILFVVLSVIAVISSFFGEVIYHLKDQPVTTSIGIILFFIGAVYFAVAIAWFFYSGNLKKEIKFSLKDPAGNLAMSIFVLIIAFVLLVLGSGLK